MGVGVGGKCSHKGVDFLIENDEKRKEDTQVCHKRERRKRLQVSYPAEDHHWNYENGNQCFLVKGHSESFTKNLKSGFMILKVKVFRL